MEDLNVIIGGGVAGLSIAANLSKNFPCLLVERNPSFGMETSSRNSEVIHAGIYYPTDSLKAKLCVRGNYLLYQYLDENKIPYNKCGKYIIARNSDELEEIERLFMLAKSNGVNGIRKASNQEIADKESNIKMIEGLYPLGLFSPNTGVLNSHKYMQSLELKAIQSGCSIAYNHEVIKLSKNGESYEITVIDSTGLQSTISASRIINASGLCSDKIAKLIGIDIDKFNYNLHFCRGHYYRLPLKPKYKFNHLIYPVPDKKTGLLGIHVTLGLDGSVRLGPDIEHLLENKQDYRIPKETQSLFYKSISTYLKNINYEDLLPDTAGIRPRLQSTKYGFADFIINEETDKGFPNFINLIGIESPGLTASLAIAEYVENLINPYSTQATI